MSKKATIGVIIVFVLICLCNCVLILTIFGLISNDDELKTFAENSTEDFDKNELLIETIVPSIVPTLSVTATHYSSSTPQPTVTSTSTQSVPITETVSNEEEKIDDEMADYASKVLPNLNDYNGNMGLLSTIFFDIANDPSLLNSDVTKDTIKSTLNNMENSSYKMKNIESPDPVIQDYMEKIYSETLKMKSNISRGINFGVVSSLEKGLVNIQNIGTYLENTSNRLEEYLLP